MKVEKIDLSDFIYNLPEEKIAQFPEKERDSSKLLIYNNGNINHDVFRNADKYIPNDSMLVFNNTRVIRARLLFRKQSGANIEILCLEPLSPSEYEISLGSFKPVEWKCLVGNLKKWKNDELSLQFSINESDYTLRAVKNGTSGEAQKIIFRWEPDNICFGQVISACGHLPLPPYINREDNAEDGIRYQTVYAKNEGSVAAPTAGLHFSDQVIEKMVKKGIRTAEVTLHVGAGTFKPVKNNDISKHEMHCEHFYVSKETLKKLYKCLGKIIAVGTTSVRTIESIYWIGVKLEVNPDLRPDELFVSQWEPYNNRTTISPDKALYNVLEFLIKMNLHGLQASTSIMIVPGYRFMITDTIITNFHQPGSTLLLLISAWVGEKWKDIYKYALENKFRFLSYGDSSILFRNH